jgi:hypothetical protein
MGVYPFMFGSIKDFEPVAEQIIKVSSNPHFE